MFWGKNNKENIFITVVHFKSNSKRKKLKKHERDTDMCSAPSATHLRVEVRRSTSVTGPDYFLVSDR